MRISRVRFSTFVVIAVALAVGAGLAGARGKSADASPPASTVAAAQSSPTGGQLSNGITFDHATYNDAVRMVGEPDVSIDHAGGTYVSGPGGSTTQASWLWKSDDHGVQWHLVGCPAKSNCQNGGGDTEIAIANNDDVFASDLQTLSCNSTFRSFDRGHTFLP